MAYVSGDTAYISGGAHGRVWAKMGTVTEVTKSGCVKVQAPGKVYTFLQNGRERGGDRWHAPQLCDRETYQRIKDIELKQVRQINATRAINALQEVKVSAEHKDNLLAKLKAAMAAVEAL